MGYIEEQIAELYHRGDLPDKNVVLFNCTHESRLIACALINRGITPKGLITPDKKVKKEYGSIWGIHVYTANEFYEEFKHDASVVIHDWDFFKWRDWFEGKGYYKGHKLTVIDPPQDLLKHQWVRRKFPRLNGSVEKWDAVQKLWLGYRTYRRLCKKYGGQTPIYVYDYDGLGDAYVFGALIKAELGDDVVITVRKASLKEVLDIFELHRVEVLTEEESRALYKLMSMCRRPLHLHPMTPVPQSFHTDILWCLYGVKLNMLDFYKVYLHLPLGGAVKLKTPSPVTNDEIDKQPRYDEISEGNTVILSPFSNSLVSFSVEFWKQLVKSIRELGFKIVVNSVGDEYLFPDTTALDYPLKDAPNVVERAGYFIGVRSGFCDLVSFTDAQKLVITPKMEVVNFNGHIFDAFSFEGMQIGRNIIEFEWKYDCYDELIRKICAALDSYGKRSRDRNVFRQITAEKTRPIY